jgi:DNA replication and repair protein RecF
VWIEKLTVQHCRVIDNAELTLSSGLNLIIGDNGSGKSSLLEGLYLLSRGRSFRTSRISELISHEHTSILSTARLAIDDSPLGVMLGIEKSSDNVRIRINKKTVKGQAELTRLLPVTLIHPEVVNLITGGPSIRRAFIDWIAFYLDDRFYDLWKRYQRILKQRNVCLRDASQRGSLSYWTQELIALQAPLHELRMQGLKKLEESIEHYQPVLWEGADLSLMLGTGFSADTDIQDKTVLVNVFDARQEQDIKTGNTFYGIHRADLNIKINDIPAAKSASRGQLKMLSILLLLAQSHSISGNIKGRGVIAIDDLAAELDDENRSRLLKTLLATGQQLLVTSTHEQLDSLGLSGKNTKMFHVKHGVFVEV